MRTGGFRTDVPDNWNNLWVIMWPLFTGILIYLPWGAGVDFYPEWLLATIPLFWIPEIVSIAVKKDSLPPLTHFVRHFLPNWLAFPLIYFLVGGIGAWALGFGYPRTVQVGVLFAVLGWMTDHFAVTYAEPDPFPHSRAKEVTAEHGERRGLTL